MARYNLRYLVSISSRGIVPKKTDLPPFKRAISNGVYMGCPGREIFYGLHKMSPVDMATLADAVSAVFPTNPQRSVHLSAFFRYVYGCFDKQGCLYSAEQMEKMKSEKRDWSNSDAFVNCLIAAFRKRDNLYGVVIATEMKAHRVGDLIIIFDNKSYLPKMLDLYSEAGELAAKIGANKNVCSAYYWAARYLGFMKEKSDFVKYAIKFLDNVEKYSLSSTIKGKTATIYSMLKATLSKEEWQTIVDRSSLYNKKTLKIPDKLLIDG